MLYDYIHKPCITIYRQKCCFMKHEQAFICTKHIHNYGNDILVICIQNKCLDNKKKYRIQNPDICLFSFFYLG